MSKSSLSTEFDLDDDAALGWATEQCSASFPRRHKNHALFDLFCTRFGKTARAVRDFVTCSSPQSNGFMEDVATTSQESPIDLRSSTQDETPSSTTDMPSSLALRDKPVRDVWSVRNGISPPRGLARHRDSKPTARHPSHCHWKTTHGQQVAANAEYNHRASGAEVTSTSTSTCGPKLLPNFFELPTKQRLRAVKQFLADFVWKANSETSLQGNKQRPLCRLMATARMIVYKPEPIKSVEAVFLVLYLTAGLLSVERTPLCFKTKFGDEVSQHIVVLVHHNGKYGAFGISPNTDLMTKDFQFESMSSIVESYLKAYKAIAHIVLKIRIGLPVEHDVMSTHFICWRHLCLSPDVKSWAECVVDIENHVLRMRRLWDLWVLTGKGDDPRKAKTATRKVLDTNFTPKLGTKGPEKRAPVTEAAPPPEGEKPLKKKKIARGRCSAQPAAAAQPHWDAESTGSNNDDYCEHCEQLKREAPPSDTKRASVTTTKRIKTSGHHSKFAHHRSSTHSSSLEQSQQQPQQQPQQPPRESSYTGALLASTADQLGLQERSFVKPAVRFQARSLNHAALAATKQILKNFVHSNVLQSSTPPRRFPRRSPGARGAPLHKLAHPHPHPLLQQPGGESFAPRRKKMHHPGPLYSLSLADQTKSKAG